MQINFILKPIDDICKEPVSSTSWFYHTDSELWIQLGESTLFEYNRGEHRYVDYYLIRFIEDFTELFPVISKSIPESLYSVVNDSKSIKDFRHKAIDQMAASEYTDADHDELNNKISWLDQRRLPTGHLKNGPTMWFFRKGDNIRIVWQTDHKREDSSDVWAARSGHTEIRYLEFIDGVEEFYNSFFKEMDKQVEQALLKDWGKITLDKNCVQEEHAQRKNDFITQLNNLKASETNDTEWLPIA
jgi:hypothetical protein